MTKNTAAWILGSAFVACVATSGLVACSSSDDNNNNGGDAPRPDSGTDATTRPDTGTQPGTDSGPGPTVDAGTDCGDPSRNPKLRPSADAGVFCPFQPRTANDASAPPCNIGDHCCVYAQNANKPSTCGAIATACELPDSGTTDWQCGEQSDCPTSGSICCFIGEPVVATDCPGKNFARGAKGTQCVAPSADGGSPSCPAGAYQVCSQANASDCPSGKACTPFTTKTIDLGACL